MNYKVFLKKVVNRFRYEAGKLKPPYHKSFSQCGEDMIARFYLHQPKGFYVDIGAYHPKKSLTQIIFSKGLEGNKY